MTARTATKPADDKPFDFNLDAVQAEVELTPFRVHFGGRRFTLAHIEDLDAWKVAEAADAGDIQMVLESLRLAMGDDDFAEFRKVHLPQYKLKALFKAYRDHCGQESGESAASSSS